MTPTEALSLILTKVEEAQTPPLMQGGTWGRADARRAFVAGASWWEYHKTGATMWDSDRDVAQQEALKRKDIQADPWAALKVMAEALNAIAAGRWNVAAAHYLTALDFASRALISAAEALGKGSE